MRYSSDPPTEPGYYWLKTPDAEEIVEVWTDPTIEEEVFWVHRCGSGDACELADVIDGLWAGPLEKPLEPNPGSVRQPRSRFI
jgi:hypothetical protein